jgi:hypothetical protein
MGRGGFMTRNLVILALIGRYMEIPVEAKTESGGISLSLRHQLIPLLIGKKFLQCKAVILNLL